MSKFNLSRISNIQDFIWIGEYSDGAHLSEFDLETGRENLFYSLDKDRLKTFGLYSGQGAEMFYDILSGMFFIEGRLLEFYFVNDKNEEFYLTGAPQRYQDVITYKDAEAVFNPSAINSGYNGITQYNFGYKTQLEFSNGMNINFKAICHIPYGSPIYISMRFVSDREFKGHFIIKRNGQICDSFPAVLSPNLGGEINWIVR